MGRDESRTTWIIAALAGLLVLGSVSAGGYYLLRRARTAAVAQAEQAGAADPTAPPVTHAALAERLQAVEEGRSAMIDCRPFAREIGDYQLKQLARAPALDRVKDLNFDGCPITDAGLAALPWMPNLKSFSASRTQLTDAGIVHLAKIGPLDGLRLDEDRLTDASAKPLAAIKTLRSLSLWKCAITDLGLDELKTLPNLVSLSLDETRVTGDGVKRAAPEMTALRELKLWKTRISPEEAAEVRRLRPNLRLGGLDPPKK